MKKENQNLKEKIEREGKFEEELKRQQIENGILRN